MKWTTSPASVPPSVGRGLGPGAVIPVSGSSLGSPEAGEPELTGVASRSDDEGSGPFPPTGPAENSDTTPPKHPASEKANQHPSALRMCTPDASTLFLFLESQEKRLQGSGE